MEDNMDFVEKKSVGKIIAIILVVILVIGLLGGGFYYLFFLRNTPKSYLENMSETIISYVNTGLKDYRNIKFDSNYNKNIKKEGTLEFNLDDKKNSLKIKYDEIISYKNELATLTLDFLNNNDSIVKGDVHLNKETLYFNASDLYPKTIRFQSETNTFDLFKDSDEENYTIADFEDMFTSLIKNYFEALKLADLKTEDISLSEVKYTYDINDKNIATVQDKFKELCIKDKRLKSLFDEDEVIKFEKTKMEIVLNRFNRKIMSYKEESDSGNLEIKKDNNSDNKYIITGYQDSEKIDGTLTIEDKKILLKFKDNEQITTTFELNYEDDLNLIITDNEFEATISLKTTSKDNYRLVIKLESTGQEKMSFDVSIDVDCSQKDETRTEGFITLKDKEDIYEMKINAESYYTDEEPEAKEYKNVIDYDKLTENDKNAILEKLVLKLIDTGLFDSLMGEGTVNS